MKGFILWSLIFASLLFYAQDPAAGGGPPSLILEVEGAACAVFYQDNAQNGTTLRAGLREQALSLARKRSIQAAVQYLRQRFPEKEARQSLISAYAAGKVRILYRKQGQWRTQDNGHQQPVLCYSETVRSEVVPSGALLRTLDQESGDERSKGPLSVAMWTRKNEYAQGEAIHLFLEGNKGFYGLVVYKDATGNLVQLLPNPYREDNYFEGGVVYEFPSGGDRFKLEVAPPFGSETLTLYAATAPLGDLQTSQAGSFYQVKTPVMDIEIEVRDVHSEGQDFVPVEFASAPVQIKTHGGK